MSEQSVFEIKAPAPLSKMRERVVSPDNIALIEEDDKARPLAKAEFKRIHEKVKELETVLLQYQYQERKAEIERLKESYLALKVDLNTTETDNAAIRQQMQGIRIEVTSIQKQMQPARAAAGKLNRLNMRLKEHRTAISNQRIYAQLQKEMAQETYIYAQAIISAWNRLGFCYDTTLDKKSRRDSVKFEYAIATPDEIQFKVKVRSMTIFRSVINHLPQGVGVWHLVKPDTLIDLCAACERNVFTPHVDENFSFRNGAWLVVERLGLTDGLFNYIELSHLLARYPQDRRGRFPLPLGVKRGRKINWIDLAKHPHLFVNGLTGSGKSNTIHVILSTLIQMHTPAELGLILIDLKEGAELLRYEDAPHTYGDVITELENVHTILFKLEALRRQRMQAIRQFASDIDGYNALVSSDQRMRRIVVVFDEYQGIYTNRALGEEINGVVIQLATKARAAGIHLIIGTQSPFSDVVPKLVRANITCVITGRQRTMGSSISTVGNKSAIELAAIPGRMMCDDGNDLFQVQMPHARPEDITAAIQKAKDWAAVSPLELPSENSAGDVIYQDPATRRRNVLIQTALDQFDGGLKARKLWEAMGDSDLSLNKVTEMVKTIAGQGEIEWAGDCYKIVRQPGNFYKLIRVDTQLHSLSNLSIAVTDYVTTHATENEGEL